MLRSHIILLEGPPGAGKSMLAPRVAGRLAAAGRRVEFPPAAERGHPIRTRAIERARAHDARAPQQYPLPDADDALLFTSTQWGALAKRALADDVVWVIEGTLFQHCLEYLLLCGASLDDVLAEQDRVLAELAEARPHLVYLAPRDPLARIDAVVAERPAVWLRWLGTFFQGHAFCRERGLRGADAVRGFYEAACPSLEACARRHAGPATIIEDPQMDWDATLERIVGALEL